jgi:hypothetical protein
MKKKELFTFLGLIFVFCFLPFALLSLIIGISVSLIWDIHWGIASFIAYLGIQLILGFLDIISDGVIGFRNLASKVGRYKD